MARHEIVEEKPIMNGQGMIQYFTDGLSEIVWADGVSKPQVLPNKKVK